MANTLTEINPINVVIVDDDDKLREAFIENIHCDGELNCVGSFGSCEELLKVLDDILPDVILMDIGLPGMSGIEGTKKIKSIYPSVEIIMLTIYNDEEKIFQSVCAGASGYILKSASQEEIRRAIKEIRNGAPMSASVARRILDYVRQSKASPIESFKLTAREMEILNLLVDGFDRKTIAEKLFISKLTVHSHLKRIYEKLHVHSKAQAVSAVLKRR
jgi:DNA-binding NarL/FixJ family response regulator